MITADLARPLELPSLQGLLRLTAERDTRVYMVGGYLRDVLLGRSPGAVVDFDFVVEGASAVALAQEFAKRLHGSFVMLDQALDTARVVLDDSQFDFAGCTGSGLHDDLHRRDFTINALAWDPLEPAALIDVTGGIDDIKNGVVRLISEKALTDDPLRILRAWRFAATLGFSIDRWTRSLLNKHSRLLTEVASERISYELFLLFDAEHCALHVKDMADCGVLEQVFPELIPTREVTANAYHHLPLFDHQLEAVRQCELTFLELPAKAKTALAGQLSHALTRFGATKIACLLHDIGKPETWVITEEGKHTFIGHDRLGAQMCIPLAKRMKWSKPLERFIESMVRWHLRPGQLFHQGDPTDRAIYRFYRTIRQDVPELVLLALSDFRSTCGPGLQASRERFEQNLFELLERYFVYIEKAKSLPRLLDGKDVMHILGISAGPVVGTILESLEEARQLGEVAGKDEAEEFVRKLYLEKYSK